MSMSWCAERSSLKAHQELSGAMLSLKQKRLLASYLLNLRRGEWFVFEMMVSDIRRLLDLGAEALATDVFLLLGLFMRDRPQLNGHAQRARAFESLYRGQSARRTIASPCIGGDGTRTEGSIEAQSHN
jgi:hypothetical protein